MPALTAESALETVEAGSSVVAGSCCGAPTTLLRALAERSLMTSVPIRLLSGLQMETPFRYAIADGCLEYVTWHVTRNVRDLVDDGLAAYWPIRAADLPAALRRTQIDVAMIRCGPPDGDGWLNYGPSLSYTDDIARHADRVIVEMDPALPRTHAGVRLHLDEVSAIVETEDETPVYRPLQTDEVSQRIASNLLTLTPDSPTIQLGIGAVPEAFARMLLQEGRPDLGFVGMATEEMVDLAGAGLLRDGVQDQAPILAVELMGGPRLMDFADQNPAVQMLPSRTLHNPAWLASLERLISVNSAVEVDLLGQVNAESLAGRQVAAVGGSLDFFEGARSSNNGLRVVAMSATARGGSVSRIVARLPAGATVTTPRHCVDAVVTEYGVAWLRDATVPERADALLAIAHPDHRDAVAEAWSTHRR